MYKVCSWKSIYKVNDVPFTYRQATQLCGKYFCSEINRREVTSLVFYYYDMFPRFPSFFPVFLWETRALCEFERNATFAFRPFSHAKCSLQIAKGVDRVHPLAHYARTSFTSVHYGRGNAAFCGETGEKVRAITGALLDSKPAKLNARTRVLCSGLSVVWWILGPIDIEGFGTFLAGFFFVITSFFYLKLIIYGYYVR